MKATVTSLYRDGKNLGGSRTAATVTGDLNLGSGRNPVTGRHTTEASILDDNGSSLLPDLHDAVVISISGHGLRLRGTEQNGKREVAQEWWCVP